ncbi:MAG: (2Fe-2S)-binding protein [Spirochaetales bacterium]|nr:(2Fe-2S)-binding protein [Spirochaetales bacterium]
MVNVIINGKEIKVKKGSSILDAAQKAGENVPTLCYLKDMFPSGACRMCVVEVEGKKGLIPSCAYPAEEGMTVITNSPRVSNARRTIIELLLASHPFDCLTCSSNRACELQKLASDYSITKVPFQGETRHHYKDFSSPSIVREPDKCILCGRCVRVCEEIQDVSAIDFTNRGFNTMVLPPFGMDLNETMCVNCGQCVIACPTGALHEVSALEKVISVLQEGKKYMIAQVAPAIRVSLGEFYGLKPGENVTGKVAAVLRKIGFKSVFDTDFSADLTIMEEGHEFVERVKNGGPFPLFTSCCPAWVKYAEHNFHDILPNISSCKSPQQMMGSLVKTYFADSKGIDPEDIYVVSVMPCTAKKFEAERPEHALKGTRAVDAVLTTREFAKLINIFGINFKETGEEEFDPSLGLTSGSGDIFAASGGVAESALRTAYNLVTGRDLLEIEFTELRGYDGIKEATLEIGGLKLNLAVANRLSNARKIVEMVKSGEKRYHFVEIMACPGGCVGGGGQIFGYDPERIEERIGAVYKVEKQRNVRLSYKSPSINAIYSGYLGKPGSEKAHKLLHTSYIQRQRVSAKTGNN